jgi:tetratricopeptide (TPR) repeat protein
MLAPAPIDPLDPLPGLEHLIEDAGFEPSEQPVLAPEAASTRSAAESTIGDEPMLAWPILDSAEPPVVDPIGDALAPVVHDEPLPVVAPVRAEGPTLAVPPPQVDAKPTVSARPVSIAIGRPAEAPSGVAMMIVRTSNGELTAAMAGAIEHAIKSNTAAPTVEAEPLRASAKLMIGVMQRLSTRIVDADAGADSAAAALAALRHGDFAEARRKLADAEIAVRADAEAGGDLEKTALRSVVDLRLLLADIEIACHDRQAAAEHLEVAVASVPAEEKMRRWSLAIRFARMLFRASMGAGGTPADVPALDRMIGAYRIALGSIVEINAPQDYVRAEVELATILNRKARLTGDIALLNEVAGFIDHTIDMLARARAMDDWAEAHTQRGITYAQLASIEGMAEHFDTAARSFDSALGHVSVQRSPLVWAEARTWFGLLLNQWGRKTGQPNRLAEGITHLRAVCDAEAIELSRTGFMLAELTLELAEAISRLAMARNEPSLHTTAISVLIRTIARTSGDRNETVEAELYDKLGESLWQLGAFREDSDMLAKAGQAIDRAIELFIASGEDAKAEARITDLERLHDFRTDLIEARVTRQVRTPRIA